MRQTCHVAQMFLHAELVRHFDYMDVMVAVRGGWCARKGVEVGASWKVTMIETQLPPTLASRPKEGSDSGESKET